MRSLSPAGLGHPRLTMPITSAGRDRGRIGDQGRAAQDRGRRLGGLACIRVLVIFAGIIMRGEDVESVIPTLRGAKCFRRGVTALYSAATVRTNQRRVDFMYRGI